MNGKNLGLHLLETELLFHMQKFLVLTKSTVFFFKLSNFVQFDNDVSKKVNLIFVIIAPANYQSEHLVALSSISNFLKIQDNVKRLREEKNLENIKLLFMKS